MKKTLKLIPAIAMLLISAVLLSTSTYAWFSMNTTVSATGMKVQAQTEGGILISTANDDSVAWSNSVDLTSAAVQLLPTSTKDASAWVHASSTSDVHAASGLTSASNYTTLTISENGVQGKVGEATYYVKETVYIKSSTVGSEATGLNVTALTVTGSTDSPALNSSLRVLVKVGTKAVIFAPIDLAEGAAQHSQDNTHLQYQFKKTDTVEAIKASETFASQNLSTAQISAISADSLPVYIYLYYEGEDAGCVSANVTTTLDELTVGISFQASSN